MALPIAAPCNLSLTSHVYCNRWPPLSSKIPLNYQSSPCPTTAPPHRWPAIYVNSRQCHILIINVINDGVNHLFTHVTIWLVINRGLKLHQRHNLEHHYRRAELLFTNIPFAGNVYWSKIVLHTGHVFEHSVHEASTDNRTHRRTNRHDINNSLHPSDCFELA